MRYTLTEDNTFRMDYRVSSDADTIVNLTNHSYFNLNGEGDILGQKLRIYASNYLEGNNQTCPTGAILPVANTPMDFTEGKLIGRDIDTGFAQTTMVGGGYDHCFVIDRARGSSQSICAWVTSEKTGISMKLYTTQPGIQLYTGKLFAGLPHPPARAACPCRSTAALRWRPSTTPAALPTRSSPPRCCGRQGVPRHHHPALFHRQAVRKIVKNDAPHKNVCSGRRFCVGRRRTPPVAYGDNPLSLLPMVAASSPEGGAFWNLPVKRE